MGNMYFNTKSKKMIVTMQPNVYIKFNIETIEIDWLSAVLHFYCNKKWQGKKIDDSVKNKPENGKKYFLLWIMINGETIPMIKGH